MAKRQEESTQPTDTELALWTQRDELEAKISAAHSVARFGFASDLENKLKAGTILEDEDIRLWKSLTERMLKYAEDSMMY